MRMVRDIALPMEAEALARSQAALAGDVVIAPGPVDAARIAAADVAYATDGDEAFAAVVVLERGTWNVVERATWTGTAPFEYRSGAFALREAGCLIPALESLAITPDVLIIDGHGVAHPRRFGLACYLGLLFDVPTVGCAKQRLCGTHEPVAEERGAQAVIRDGEDTVGAALRTQDGIKPMYVSPGHRYDVTSACGLILACAPTYRMPEPIRAAHHMSIELRAGKRLS